VLAPQALALGVTVKAEQRDGSCERGTLRAVPNVRAGVCVLNGFVLREMRALGDACPGRLGVDFHYNSHTTIADIPTDVVYRFAKPLAKLNQ
jgi:hypothetical protein